MSTSRRRVWQTAAGLLMLLALLGAGLARIERVIASACARTIAVAFGATPPAE